MCPINSAKFCSFFYKGCCVGERWVGVINKNEGIMEINEGGSVLLILTIDTGCL